MVMDSEKTQVLNFGTFHKGETSDANFRFFISRSPKYEMVNTFDYLK